MEIARERVGVDVPEDLSMDAVGDMGRALGVEARE